MKTAPNQALQRTPGFGVQLPGATLIRPAQSRAVLPARVKGLRPHAAGAPGPESLSLGSLGDLRHLFRETSNQRPEMNKTIEKLTNQNVVITLRSTVPVTLKGKLIECDNTFVVIEDKNNAVAIPLTSILHITGAPAP